jgi:hypothetical protein
MSYKTTMRMPENCPVCEQKFDLQTGFYFGTGYVSYGLTIFISLITLCFMVVCRWHGHQG